MVKVHIPLKLFQVGPNPFLPPSPTWEHIVVTYHHFFVSALLRVWCPYLPRPDRVPALSCIQPSCLPPLDCQCHFSIPALSSESFQAYKTFSAQLLTFSTRTSMCAMAYFSSWSMGYCLMKPSSDACVHGLSLWWDDKLLQGRNLHPIYFYSWQHWEVERHFFFMHIFFELNEKYRTCFLF